MSDQQVDQAKRTWLIATGCVGTVGGVAAAIPFVSTFQPSEKAKAAGAAVEVDISGLQPGEMKTAEWRGKPVWLMRRTPEMLATLSTLDSQLADPESKREQQPAGVEADGLAEIDRHLDHGVDAVDVQHQQGNRRRCRDSAR